MLIPSVICHEVAHGYVAYRLGDPTAKAAGRITLNPIKHVDPVGTVILPAILAFSGAPIFGWAKPVPFNPRNLREPRTGELLIGFSGPLTNLALALAGTALLWVLGFAPGGTAAAVAATLAFYLILTNLVLMFFNLLPIPPLDGSSFFPLLLPPSAMPAYRAFERQSFLILMVLVFVLPSVAGVSPIGEYFRYTVDPMLGFLLRLAS
ncbi:MAG: site-2 protease family protein [Coriobacteriia bacterium]|nr:site-2 protease family protein [Coriobacteriia bacterium]